MSTVAIEVKTPIFFKGNYPTSNQSNLPFLSSTARVLRESKGHCLIGVPTTSGMQVRRAKLLISENSIQSSVPSTVQISLFISRVLSTWSFSGDLGYRGKPEGLAQDLFFITSPIFFWGGKERRKKMIRDREKSPLMWWQCQGRLLGSSPSHHLVGSLSQRHLLREMSWSCCPHIHLHRPAGVWETTASVFSPSPLFSPDPCKAWEWPPIVWWFCLWSWRPYSSPSLS